LFASSRIFRLSFEASVFEVLRPPSARRARSIASPTAPSHKVVHPSKKTDA
jgi:hypothetical protein